MPLPAADFCFVAVQNTSLIATVPRIAAEQYTRETRVRIMRSPFAFEPIRILMSWHLLRLRALVEQWCKQFGCLPPCDGPAPPPDVTPIEERQDGNDLMTRADVARKLRTHVATIQRMEQDGRLPKPTRLGVRGRRHLARDIDALIDKLDEQRNGPRKA